MEKFGSIIKKIRVERKLPLRIVAAYLDIDQAILSKIEHGQRNATRELVLKLASYFQINETDILVSWLSDKLVYEVADEKIGLQALQVAEEKVAYQNFKKEDRKVILKKLKLGISKFKKVEKAWIYGSFAREDDNPKSDIDIAIQTNSTFSYFDLAEVKHVLENEINRSIDIGFLDSFKPYIIENVKPDLKLIYEK
jgi:predicted nucleotidyltransferase/plasmid maintenance system antidote protein VapI